MPQHSLPLPQLPDFRKENAKKKKCRKTERKAEREKIIPLARGSDTSKKQKFASVVTEGGGGSAVGAQDKARTRTVVCMLWIFSGRDRPLTQGRAGG